MYLCSSNESGTGGAGAHRASQDELAPLFQIWLALEREIARAAHASDEDAHSSRRMDNLARVQWHVLDLAAELSGLNVREVRVELAKWRSRYAGATPNADDSMKFDAAALSSLRDLVGLADNLALRKSNKSEE